MSLKEKIRNIVTIMVALIVGVLLTMTTPSLAQMQQRVPCGDRNAILEHLKDGYSEGIRHMGLDAQGRVLEVVTSSSGTWTMLVSTPGGLTCLIASGIAWEDIPDQVAEDPSA